MTGRTGKAAAAALLEAALCAGMAGPLLAADAPSDDSQPAAETPKPAKRAKHRSTIDKFLSGAVKFFGAEPLLGEPSAAASATAGQLASPQRAAPQEARSSFTSLPDDRRGASEKAGALDAVAGQPAAATPALPPNPISGPGSALSASNPFLVSTLIPGGATYDSVVTSPQYQSAQNSLSNAINSVGWAAAINAVEVADGFNSFSGALTNVEGVTLKSVLDLGSTAAGGADNFVASGNASTAAGVLVGEWNPFWSAAGTQWASLQTTTVSDSLSLLNAYLAGFTIGGLWTSANLLTSSGWSSLNSNLGLPTNWFSISGAKVSVAPTAAPMAVQSVLASVAQPAAPSAAAGQLAAVQALSAVEDNLAGQFVSRVPPITGSPSQYISKIFSELNSLKK